MSDRLRVALVTSYPVDAGRIAGGIQAVSVRLIEALRCIPGLDLHVVHCHSDIDVSRTVTLPDPPPEACSPVTLHFMAQKRRRLMPNLATAIGRVGERLREIAPDVVHAHGHSYAVAALRAGYQPVWTIHGVLRQEALQYRGVFHSLRFALARFYEQQALAQVELISTVSPYVMEAYRDRTRATWRIIDNPAPQGHFALPRRPISGRVLLPAAVIPLKDPLTAVQAAAFTRPGVPGFVLRIAGSLTDAAYVRRVRGAIAELGMEGFVVMLGPLSAREVADELTHAAAVVVSSRQEVSPMALIEAMAAGVPVVASAVGGVPWLVDNGASGFLVPAGEPRALAAALETLLTDAATAQRIGTAARAVAARRFDPTQVAGQYLDLYRQAARKPHAVGVHA